MAAAQAARPHVLRLGRLQSSPWHGTSPLQMTGTKPFGPAPRGTVCDGGCEETFHLGIQDKPSGVRGTLAVGGT